MLYELIFYYFQYELITVEKLFFISALGEDLQILQKIKLTRNVNTFCFVPKIVEKLGCKNNFIRIQNIAREPRLDLDKIFVFI